MVYSQVAKPASGTQPARELRTKLNFHRRKGTAQSLGIGVAGDKVDSGQSQFDHSINGIGSPTSKPYHFQNGRLDVEGYLLDGFCGHRDVHFYLPLCQLCCNTYAIPANPFDLAASIAQMIQIVFTEKLIAADQCNLLG